MKLSERFWNKRKGFTIVELVIVIAIIAILAAVLIPTFSNVIQRSKISADTQLCRNLNTVLTMATSEGRIPGSMYDVLYLISESGYLLANLNPTAEGYYYAWDSEGQKMVYIKEDLQTIVYPEDYKIDVSKCWITVGDQAEAERVAAAGYNLYLENYIEAIELHNVAVSIDTGAFKLNKLTIDGEVVDAKDVVLTGNFGATKLDCSNVSFSNSGTITNLNIGSATAAMTINGNVGSVSSSITKTTMSSSGAVGEITSGSVSNTAGIAFTKSSGAVTGAVDGKVSVSTKENIENIRTQISAGRTFKGETLELTGDINMGGIAFQPISNFSRSNDAAEYFQGTFDGHGHTIQNFSTKGFAIAGLNAGTNTSTPYFGVEKVVYHEAVYGLFGAVKDATIKNVNVTCAIDLVLDDSAHYVGDSVGGLVGFATGDFVTFENCTVSGTINGYDGVGGLLGRTKAKITTFKNCTNNANVTGVRKTGGFIGSSYTGNYSVEYNNCVNNGNITCLGVERDIELYAWNVDSNDNPTTRVSGTPEEMNGKAYYTVSASNGEYLSASGVEANGTRSLSGGNVIKIVGEFVNNGVIKVGEAVLENGGTHK